MEFGGGVCAFEPPGDGVPTYGDHRINISEAGKVIDGMIQEADTGWRIITRIGRRTYQVNIMGATEGFTEKFNPIICFRIGWLDDEEVRLHGGRWWYD